MCSVSGFGPNPVEIVPKRDWGRSIACGRRGKKEFTTRDEKESKRICADLTHGH